MAQLVLQYGSRLTCNRCATATPQARLRHLPLRRVSEPAAACGRACSRPPNDSLFPSSRNTSHTDTAVYATRRAILLTGLATASPLLPGSAKGSKLGPTVDRVWEGMGGGPGDLYFPEAFLGMWEVESTLVRVETPLGPEFVPDLKVVGRAISEDLDQPVYYRVSFMVNKSNRVIPDRRFNTSQLLSMYLGPKLKIEDRIEWNPEDPNMLSMLLPGEQSIVTRVTRRSFAMPSPGRIDTSEYFEQIFDVPDRPTPKVKASQCFTKYRFRSEDAAAEDGGPTIIATQVVSDYLTSYDNAALLIQAAGQPVVIYTYRMVFFRPTVDSL